MDTEKSPKDLLEWLGFTAKPDWTVARPLGYAMGITVIALFVMAIVTAFWTMIDALVHPSNPSLGVGTLIVALLGGPFLIWRTIIAHRTLGFQKEGHITDRISKAVEQLGAEKTVRRQRVSKSGKKVFEKDHDGQIDFAKPVFDELTLPNIEVRIGGLLSLERISQDSMNYDGGRDHIRVMEILAAYIRENAKRNETELVDQSVEPMVTLKNPDIVAIVQPREDIKIALGVIGLRTKAQMHVEANWLTQSNEDFVWPFDKTLVEGMKRDIVNLYEYSQQTPVAKSRGIRSYVGYRVDLRNCNFTGAAFDGYDFCGAIFDNCILDETSFFNCSFTGAFFRNAQIRNARFDTIEMSAGHFTAVEFEGSKFFNCVTASSSFAQTSLARTAFHNCSFFEVAFRDAKFNAANIRNSEFVNCDLSFSDMRNAKIENSLIRFCSFEGANFYLQSFWLSLFCECDLRGIEHSIAREINSLGGFLAVLGEAAPQIEVYIKRLLDSCYADSSVLIPSTTKTRPEHWPTGTLDFQELKSRWFAWKQNP
jgi:uncharacterized protein YjbI with pentapeptide repeats